MIQRHFDMDLVYRYALRDIRQLRTPDQVDQEDLEWVKTLVDPKIMYEYSNEQTLSPYRRGVSKTMYEGCLVLHLKRLIEDEFKIVIARRAALEKRKHLTLVK